MTYLAILALLIIYILFNIVPFKTLLDDKKSIWKTNSNNTHLTFDDGPNQKITPYILDELKKYKQQTTFFLIPEYITTEDKHIIKRIHNEHHIIALHGRSKALVFRPKKYLAKYINDFNKKISSILEISFKTKYFRPPSLWRTPLLKATLKRYNIFLIGVSPFCWIDQFTKNPSTILKRFKKNMKNGSICVIHDGIAKYKNPSMKWVKKALPAILSYMKERNIKSTGIIKQ